jgi:AmiR/NasT family two-component response regulator
MARRETVVFRLANENVGIVVAGMQVPEVAIGGGHDVVVLNMNSSRRQTERTRRTC